METSYAVFLNTGLMDGLKKPQSPDNEQTVQDNIRIINERVQQRLNALTESKLLEPLHVHSIQEAIGTMCVSGTPEDVEKLDAFLKEKNWGIVTENIELQGSRVYPSTPKKYWFKRFLLLFHFGRNR